MDSDDGRGGRSASLAERERQLVEGVVVWLVRVGGLVGLVCFFLGGCLVVWFMYSLCI